jgi:tetratricopeptide (TPR) repeat protein
MHRHGASYTWRQLIADKGVVDAERILGIIRYDLGIFPNRILLCIDEVDSLQVEQAEHAQLLHFIEELQKLATLLLIGQRVVLTTQEQIEVGGLDEAGLIALCKRAALLRFSPAEQQALLQKSGGNPALLTLLLTLLRSGDARETVIDALANSASFEALFTRIWHRLSENERKFLLCLAVYRHPVPLDAFMTEQPVVERLLQKGLLQSDKWGGITLLSHLHRLVYQRIPDAQRKELHLRAMHLRAERAQIVAAIYHALKADEPAQAVWLWFTHRTTEIERGQGVLVLPLLLTILPETLPDERDQTALRIARAELLQMVGRAEESAKDLLPIHPSTGKHGYGVAQQLLANSFEMGGQVEQALTTYRASLDILLGSPQLRAVSIHTRSSFLHAYRLGNMQEAKKDALRARMRAEMFDGQIEEQMGNYAAAFHRYEMAFALVKELPDAYAEQASLCFYLGNLQLKTGNFSAAIELVAQAIEGHRQRGDTIAPLYNQMTLAYAYLLSGRLAESYQQASESLAIAQQINHGYLIAGLSAGVGEAAIALGRTDEAEYYALQSLQQEETYFRPSALILLGQVFETRQNFVQSRKLFLQAIESAQEVEDMYMEVDAWRKLGNMHFRAEQKPLAIEAYQSALTLYKRLNLPKELTEVQAQLNILLHGKSAAD